MKRNIPLMYITGALVWVRFYIPVIALFYIASQVTFEEFTFIFAAFSLSILLFEIPSGVFADIVGKKNSLIVSRILYLVQLFIMAFFNGFWPLLIGQIVVGFGVSLTSGAREALMYDTLKKLKREKEHKRISGIAQSIAFGSTAFAFILGGVLFNIHYKLPVMLSIPFCVLAIILTFFLKEPYKSKKKVTFKNSWNHMKEGFLYFANHSYLKYLAFFSLPVYGIIHVSLSASSVYLAEIMVPIYLIGVVAFVTSSIMAYMAKTAHTIEEKIGEKDSLFLVPLLLIVAVFTMSLMIDYVGVLFYLLIPLVFAYYTVVENHYVNAHISTSHRATMISIKNMFLNVGILLLFPIFGRIKENSSMSYGFIFLGVLLVVYMIGLHFYSKKWRLSEIEKA